VWSEQQKLEASDAAPEDRLGYSVSISGDTVVAGARVDDVLGSLDAGSADVLRALRDDVERAAEAHGVGERSGVRALRGVGFHVRGPAVIGAERDATVAGIGRGRAYVFVRSGTAWSEQQKLVASDGGAGHYFGGSVSVSGDTLVVGARLATAPGGSRGRLRVRTVGHHVSQQQKLVASDGASGDFFGASVSVSGKHDRRRGGARREPGRLRGGLRLVFVRSGTVWTEQQKLMASDGADFDDFGFSVDLDGDRAVVGAMADDNAGGPNAGLRVRLRALGYGLDPAEAAAGVGRGGLRLLRLLRLGLRHYRPGRGYADDTSGQTAAGSAYVFVGSGPFWSEQQKLVASDAAQDDQFGARVSVYGNTAVIGASFDDSRGMDIGSAYVFTRFGTTWTQAQKLKAPDGAPGDLFGEAVAVSTDTIVVALRPTTVRRRPRCGLGARLPPTVRVRVRSRGHQDGRPEHHGAGQPVTYTITVSNAGPDPVAGAPVVTTCPPRCWVPPGRVPPRGGPTASPAARATSSTPWTCW
jgi:hypothetical protein